MRWFLYNILFAVGYALMLPRFLTRMLRRGGYAKNFLNRFAVYSPNLVGKIKEHRRIWIHAVSVGEIYVAFRFIDEIRRREPGCCFLITTTTSTGYRIAESRLHDSDVLLYYPADFPSVVKRALNIIRPEAFILTECELWPNMLRHLALRNVPVVLVNGRISRSSYKGYKALKLFFTPTIRSISLLLVQTDEEERRLRDLGADPRKIKIVGSAKYDVAQPDDLALEQGKEILHAAGIDPAGLIVVGGSTWPGEEAILLDIHARLKKSFGDLKLILVPRHAERRKEVIAEIQKRNISFVQRSRQTDRAAPEGAPPEVLLVDTTGELKCFYACASVIFVGKSLTNHGGQNVIEPAAFGKAVVVGPNMENFPVVMTDFMAAKAILQVGDAAQMEQTIKGLLNNPAARSEYGSRALAVVNTKRGVVSRSVDLMLKEWTCCEHTATTQPE